MGGIWYVHHVRANRLASKTAWLCGVLYAVAFFVLVVGVLTYKVLADKNSPYPFDEKELARFRG